MKSKHTGILGMALAGLSLLVICGQLLWASWYRVRPSAIGTRFDFYASDRVTVDPEALARMDLVEPTLPKLVRPSGVVPHSVIASDAGVNYAMFGERAPTPVPAGPARGPRVRKPKPHPYQVAMTYVSGEHRYAVIDSKLYREQERLPHGESVAEIVDGSVRLESAAGPRWIEVQGAGGR